MKALFRKSILVLMLSFGFVSQSGFAQAGARVKLIWMGVEAAIKAGEREFEGLGKILSRDLKLNKISGLQDKELGLMFESIRLAAVSAGNKDVKSLEDFVAAIAADPELKTAIDRILSKVNDAAATLGKTEFEQLDSVALGKLVTETAQARANKIDVGASNIIPCPDCGISNAMRIRGVTLYLRSANAAERRAIGNAAKLKADLGKALRLELAKISGPSGNGRLNLKLSTEGEKSFEALSATDKALVHQLTKDAAGALDQETQDLAKALVMFSRDADQTVDLANDGDRLYVMYIHMSEGKSRANLKRMLDDANAAAPEAGRLRERRINFCQAFRKTAGATPAGMASMKTIDQEGCFGNIFKICK